MAKPMTITSSLKSLLRPLWRWLVRFRRLWQSANKLGPVQFAKFAFFDLVLNPVCRRLKIRGQTLRIKVRGYAGPFVLRMATTDAECFLEVILEEEYKTATRLMNGPCGLILDAGSNAGYSLRYFQRACPGAVIVGVEPDEENRKVCMENVRYGEAPERVKLFGYCVAAHSGPVRLDRTRGEWAIRMSHVSQADSGKHMQARTVGQILEEAGVGELVINLFKCDIEGAEIELFSRPGAWLERVDCLAVETHSPYFDVSLMDDLRRFSSAYEFFPENEMVFARRSDNGGKQKTL